MLEGVQHHQNVMVLDGVEERREEQRRKRDRDGHRAEQRAQTHRQEHEEGRIDDDEKIIEPEIDPQPERMRRIAELIGDESGRRRELEKFLREEAGGQNRRHHDEDDRRRQERKRGQGAVQRHV